MKLHIPTGLSALLASFEQVLIACHLPERQACLSASFRARLQPAQARLSALAERHAACKRLWALALATRRRHQDRLERLVRDAWIMIKRRDQREGQDGLLITFYRMPQRAPQHGSALIWLEHGRNLVTGERLATSAGHAPMAYPTIDELAPCLEAASAAEDAYLQQVQALKFLENKLREAQRQAAHLLRCLAARLRESQFDERPERARALLRSFGFRFKASPSDDAEARAELAQAETVHTQPVAVADQPTEAPETAPEPARPEPASRWLGRLRRWGQGLAQPGPGPLKLALEPSPGLRQSS